MPFLKKINVTSPFIFLMILTHSLELLHKKKHLMNNEFVNLHSLNNKIKTQRNCVEFLMKNGIKNILINITLII